jgi:flagellar assembly protein FliH
MPDRTRPSRIVGHGAAWRRAFALPGGTASDGLRPASAADPTEEACARGRRAGIAEGRQEAAQDFERQIAECRQHLATSLGRMAEREQELRRDHERLFAELALEIASRIVRERIDAGDPVAARALREAVEALPAPGPLRARVHPSDLEPVRRELAAAPLRREVELAADEAIERGGCVVESASGTLDATLQAAFDAVRAAVWAEATEAP